MKYALVLALALSAPAAAQQLPPGFRWTSLPIPSRPPVCMGQADMPGWPMPLADILRPRAAANGPGPLSYYNLYTNRVETCLWDGARFHTMNGMIYP